MLVCTSPTEAIGHDRAMTGGPQPRQIDSWEVAEENAVVWMRHWGFDDAVTTPGGSDGGIDVWSRRALAQVKWEGRQVGTPDVQRLVGARGLDHHKQLIFFSGAGYASRAVEYADQMNIALFKYDLNGRPTPASHVATSIAGRPSTTVLHGTAAAGLSGSRSTADKWRVALKVLVPFIGFSQLIGGIFFIAAYVARRSAGTLEENPVDLEAATVSLVLGLIISGLWVAHQTRRRKKPGPYRSKLPSLGIGNRES